MAFDVDERFIAAAEDALGCSLPNALKARLSVNNGGETLIENEYWQLFPVKDTSSTKRLSRTFNDIIRETTSARKWPHFPSNAIAVASSGSGDLLMIFPQSEEFFEWDHETGRTKLTQVKFS